MEDKKAFRLFVRYLILLGLGLFNLKLLYFVFTPLTVYPVFAILSLVYVQIIPACIAGAAYYLLLILNLSTPMDFGKRVKSIFFLLAIFLVLNIARILIFAAIAVLGKQYFYIAHKLTWYFGSTVLVVLVWFANVWFFKIKEVPIYTDVKSIFKDIAKTKKLRKSKSP